MNEILFVARQAPESARCWPIVLRMAVCTAPAMTLLGLGSPALAAYCFYTIFGLTLIHSVLRQNPMEVTCLLIGCLPALMLFRDFLSYSSVEIILGLGIAVWMLYGGADFNRLFSDPIVQTLFGLVVIYWLISYINTGDYSANLRLFELTFSALSVALLGKNRAYLATALTGLVVTAFLIGVALLGQGDRLGMASTDGVRLGNPITFGIPMALIFLLSMAEDGRWLMLRHRRALRIGVNIAAGVFLLLSTSRGSWFVVATCLLIILIASRQRMRLLGSIAVAAAALSIWAYFADPTTVENYIYKTFYDDQYWSKVNPRVAQWDAFPTAFADSPVYGFGPGSGRAISLQYSGHKLIWHSLYLHIGIECGLIGLILLTFLLGSLIWRAFLRLYIDGEVEPLLGIVGFIIIGISIPAIDGASGLFLGLSMVGPEVSALWIARSAPPATTHLGEMAMSNG